MAPKSGGKQESAAAKFDKNVFAQLVRSDQ